MIRNGIDVGADAGQQPCHGLLLKPRRRAAAASPRPAPRPAGAPPRRPRESSSRLSRRLAGAGLRAPPRPRAAMSRKPIRPARKAATATSLAALSTVGALPPCAQRLAGQAERRKALVIRRLEGQPADRGEIEARRRRARSARASPACRRSGCACRAGRAGPAPSRRGTRPGCARSIPGGPGSRSGPAPRPNRWMRLDQLEPLVHHGRRIDRDLGAHAPVGMGDRLARRDARHLGSRAAPERPARRGQDQALDAVGRPRRAAPGRSRCARNRPAAARRRCVATSAISSAPAQTRHSLVASATIAPRRTAVSVGPRPAAPTIAAITQSAGRAAASARPVRRRPRPRCRCRRAPPSGAGSRRVADHREPRAGGAARRAASASTLRCAVSASTR